MRNKLCYAGNKICWITQLPTANCTPHQAVIPSSKELRLFDTWSMQAFPKNIGLETAWNREQDTQKAYLDKDWCQPFGPKFFVYAEEVDVHHINFLLLDPSQGRHSRNKSNQFLRGLDSDGHMPFFLVPRRMEGPLQKLFGIVESAKLWISYPQQRLLHAYHHAQKLINLGLSSIWNLISLVWSDWPAHSRAAGQFCKPQDSCCANACIMPSSLSCAQCWPTEIEQVCQTDA